MNLTPSSLPARNSYSKNFSTAISLGANNSANRISRRKSSTMGPVNMAALAAIRTQAAQGITNDSVRLNASTDRKSPNANSEAVEDGPAIGKIIKGRGRRPSELPKLAKERTKSSTAGDLKCDSCGKGYKHASCLTKHLYVCSN